MLSKESIKEFKKIYKEEFGEEISDKEAFEQGTNLVNFFGLLHKIDVRGKIRKKKLKQHPKGFHLSESETYNCCVCRDSVEGETSWYDKDGTKCLLCQKALDKGIIPPEVCHNNDNWYAIWEFDYYFNMKAPTVRKFIRQGKLKARIIPNEEGRTHFEVIMIKDNSDVLPAKPKSLTIRDKDGRYHTEYEDVKLDKLLN